MEQLKQMKESLMGCVQGEIYNIKEADFQELGAAVDMIKDLAEAIYYCTITEAMEKDKDEEGHKYYPAPIYYDYRRYYPMMDQDPMVMMYHDKEDPYHYQMYRDMDKNNGKMYYSGNGNGNGGSSSNGGNSYSSSNGNGNSSRGFYEREYPYPIEFRDKREGRSPMSRKTYMEAKEKQHGKETQMKELENYMQELTSDITEMIRGSSPEEKQLLQKKISALAAKIEQVNV